MALKGAPILGDGTPKWMAVGEKAVSKWMEHQPPANPSDSMMI